VNALNLNHSPERPLYFGNGPIRSLQAQAKREARKRRVSYRHPGVSDSIELHNGRQVTRLATIKGSWGNAQGKYPSMGANVKRGVQNGRVASDGDR